MNKQRLEALATHFESGKLGHEVFDFGTYNANKERQLIISNECGYAGCALGECPILFPEDWIFGVWGPRLINLEDRSVIYSATVFFDITTEEADHLFFPRNQDTTKYGGKELNRYATKEEVAANIRAFITVKENENQSSPNNG